MVKNLPANAREAGSVLESGRSFGVGNGNPLHYSNLKKFHGQKILTGYSPWGHEESDMIEHARMYRPMKLSGAVFASH